MFMDHNARQYLKLFDNFTQFISPILSFLNIEFGDFLTGANCVLKWALFHQGVLQLQIFRDLVSFGSAAFWDFNVFYGNRWKPKGFKSWMNKVKNLISIIFCSAANSSITDIMTKMYKVQNLKIKVMLLSGQFYYKHERKTFSRVSNVIL